MTGLDRGCGCGIRQFRTQIAAEKARDKNAALPGADESPRLRECPRRPGVWHLVTADRNETFPAAVAALIAARDPWCVLCGSPRGLHLHHRRIRGIGGDSRPHAACACNGLRICRHDHGRIHDTAEGRVLAEAEGLIILRATLEPFTLSVLVHLQGDVGGLRKFPACDGRWVDSLSELAA